MIFGKYAPDVSDSSHQFIHGQHPCGLQLIYGCFRTAFHVLCALKLSGGAPEDHSLRGTLLQVPLLLHVLLFLCQNRPKMAAVKELKAMQTKETAFYGGIHWLIY